MAIGDESGGDESKGPLGQRVEAPERYAPGVLFPIPRARGRALLGLAQPHQDATLPFVGEDLWTCYEVSWLNAHGVPRRGTLELRVPCTSPNLVESKSLKLYLNSLNFHIFASTDALLGTIAGDVERTVGAAVSAALQEAEAEAFRPSDWTCVDDEDVGEIPPEALDAPDTRHLRLRVLQDATGANAAPPPEVTERLVSHLLRTLCPVTGQPDWGSLLIEYSGPPIDHAGLLRYIVSLRKEIGFHENAIERITLAIMHACRPTVLRVSGRFMRRGGVDINPTRVVGEAEAVEAALGPMRVCRVPGQ